MSTFLSKASKKLSGLFLQGLAITLPIVLTIAILAWLGTMAEDFLGSLVREFLPGWHYWTGLGVALAVLLVLLAGVLMNVWVTRRLVAWLDALLDRIPLVKSIYGSLRDFARLFSGKDAKSAFKQVVAVHVADDVRLIGFVTLENYTGLSAAGADDGLVGVYLPMSYQIGGYTVFLPKSRVEPLAMSVEDAMRFTLTAGVSGGKPGAA